MAQGIGGAFTHGHYHHIGFSLRFRQSPFHLYGKTHFTGGLKQLIKCPGRVNCTDPFLTRGSVCGKDFFKGFLPSPGSLQIFFQSRFLCQKISGGKKAHSHVVVNTHFHSQGFFFPDYPVNILVEFHSPDVGFIQQTVFLLKLHGFQVELCHIYCLHLGILSAVSIGYLCLRKLPEGVRGFSAGRIFLAALTVKAVDM